MRVLNVSAMRDAEKAAVVAGTSYDQLMENAGTLAAQHIARLAEEQQRAPSVLFLCGAGNNAGDAFVAARHLAGHFWNCQILPLIDAKYSTLAKRNLLRLPDNVQQVTPQTADYAAGVIVDAVFGIGFYGKLPPQVQEAFRKANAQDAMRVALDLPSGLNADTGDVAEGTFHAAYTLTFGAYKPGLLVYGANAYAGEVSLLDIGL